MTIWIATIDWDHNPSTGLPQQGYTVLMPTRDRAEKRVMDCLGVVTKADPEAATVVAYTRTPLATRASVDLAGQRFDYRVIKHDGTMREPGYQAEEK